MKAAEEKEAAKEDGPPIIVGNWNEWATRTDFERWMQVGLAFYSSNCDNSPLIALCCDQMELIAYGGVRRTPPSQLTHSCLLSPFC